MCRLRRPSRLAWTLVAGVCSIALIVGTVKLGLRWSSDADAESARRAVTAGRSGDAIAPLARWLRAQPDSAEAHALRAEVAIEEGDLELVTKEMNKARSSGWPHDKLGRLHAMSLSRIGRYQEAEPILVRLYSERSTRDPGLDQALARVYMMTHRLPQARMVIEKWIDDAPADGRPFLWLTELDLRMEADNSANMEKHFREALKRDPDLDAARLGLADALRKSHRNAEAKAEYDRYLARHPRDAAALAGAGRNAFELHDTDAAVRLLDQSLAISPDQLDALKGRAAIDFAQDKPAPALARLDRALHVDPHDTEALYNRSRVRSFLGDDAGAKRDLQDFSRLKKDQAELIRTFTLTLTNPDDNDLRCKIAAWMFTHGREEDALGWAKSVLAADPNHAATNALLADYYDRQKHNAGLANFYRLRAASAQTHSP